VNELLVNADDFGLHEDINRGVLDTVEAGVVRSLSVCATGAAPDWPRLRALQSAGVRVGVHLTLTGEPWLTTGEILSDWRALALRLQDHGLAERARAELAEQVARCKANGIEPTHLDSHQHVHILPGIWQACLGFCVRRVRVPAAPSWRLARRTPAGLVLQALSLRRRRAVAALPCIGLAHSGNCSIALVEQELRLAAGRDVELIVHPGFTTPALLAKYGSWKYHWSDERAALLDPRFRDAIQRFGYRLAGA
jgi:chitin disaccharide deacetylase